MALVRVISNQQSHSLVDDNQMSQHHQKLVVYNLSKEKQWIFPIVNNNDVDMAATENTMIVKAATVVVMAGQATA